MIRPGRDEVLATVRRVVHPWVLAARARGVLPAVSSDEFASADWVVQVACLLVAAEAWVVEDPRQTQRAELAETSRDIHGGDPTFWRSFATNHVPYSDLQRRRYPPTGDRDLWIRYGPAGPPAEVGGTAA